MKKLLIVGLLLGSQVSYASAESYFKAKAMQAGGLVAFGTGFIINLTGALNVIAGPDANINNAEKVVELEYGNALMGFGTGMILYGTVQKRAILQERAAFEPSLVNTNPLNTNPLPVVNVRPFRNDEKV